MFDSKANGSNGFREPYTYIVYRAISEPRDAAMLFFLVFFCFLFYLFVSALCRLIKMNAIDIVKYTYKSHPTHIAIH